MDIASILGFIGGWAMIILSMISSGGQPAGYIDIPSVFMTIGGSAFALLFGSSVKDFFQLFKVMGKILRVPDFGELKKIEMLVSYAERARKEGLLSLEEEIETIDDEFMKTGLRMVVDSIDATIVRNVMESEINQMNERHGKWFKMIDNWAKLAPGFGMLGTVQGLIAMMKKLEDKSSIGRNMAVALVTTYYGAIMANFILTPIMGKLIQYDAQETKVREMVLEGVLSIQQGDNPHIVQQKLTVYLTPEQRKKFEEMHPSS